MQKEKNTENQTRISLFLRDKIDSSLKSRSKLAEEMGFSSPNFLSMIKAGSAKVPLDKVVAIAKPLDIDPGYLMTLALEQFFPDKDNDVWDIFRRIVSLNEMELIRALREVYKDLDPAFTETQVDAAIALLVQLNPPSQYRSVVSC